MIDFDHKETSVGSVKVAMNLVRARRSRLTRLLEEHRYLPVAELKKRLGVSEATLRRDLALLAKEKKVQRTYGGALMEFNATFASFEERASRARDAKEAIARAARARLRAGMTCFFDAGTTLHALADALRRQPVRGLVIVTNNVPVAEALGDQAGLEAHLIGGQFFGRQSVLLGKDALACVKRWKFDRAFLGAEAFSAAGVWNSQPDINAFQRTVLGRCEEAFFLLDASKLGRATDHWLAGWGGGFQVLTDAPASAIRAARLPAEARITTVRR
jgi:DeoR/GlpR family transcriptional regulator of sugar metabolism